MTPPTAFFSVKISKKKEKNPLSLLCDVKAKLIYPVIVFFSLTYNGTKSQPLPPQKVDKISVTVIKINI